MAMVPNGVETLPKISMAWVGCTNVTDDRQTTDDRRTDERRHIANMSSRSLIKPEHRNASHAHIASFAVQLVILNCYVQPTPAYIPHWNFTLTNGNDSQPGAGFTWPLASDSASLRGHQMISPSIQFDESTPSTTFFPLRSSHTARDQDIVLQAQ